MCPGSSGRIKDEMVKIIFILKSTLIGTLIFFCAPIFSMTQDATTLQKRAEVEIQLAKAYIARGDIQAAFRLLEKVRVNNKKTLKGFQAEVLLAEICLQHFPHDQIKTNFAIALFNNILNYGYMYDEVAYSALKGLDSLANKDNAAAGVILDKCFKSNPNSLWQFHAGALLARRSFKTRQPDVYKVYAQPTLELGKQLLTSFFSGHFLPPASLSSLPDLTLEIALNLMFMQWLGKGGPQDISGAVQARNVIIAVIQQGKFKEKQEFYENATGATHFVFANLHNIFIHSASKKIAGEFLYPLLSALVKSKIPLTTSLNSLVNNLLGEVYYHGWGVEKNYETAYHYYTAGSWVLIDAIYHLGVLYLHGWGTEINIKNAQKCFEKVITEKIENAHDFLLVLAAYQHLIYFLLWHDLRNEENIDKAEALILAATTLHEQAHKFTFTAKQLARLQTIDSALHVWTSEIALRSGDFESAKTGFEWAITRHHNPHARIFALIKLGDMYRLGLGVDRSDIIADDYYQKALKETDDKQLQKMALDGLDALEQEANERAQRKYLQESSNAHYQARMKAIEEETERLRLQIEEAFKNVPRLERPD